jgi:acetylornithine deacetylase/succinyl-diaminopimelate desuccinylase-like protein
MTAPESALDPAALLRLVGRIFEEDALPVLTEYATIPNLSPDFDPDWAAHGHMDAAAKLLESWSRGRAIEGISVELVTLAGRTPVLLCEIPPAPGAERAGTVLCYGHLDKQPPLGAWRDGLGPFSPVREGDRLYGRGTADDGYAVFAALTAIEACRAAGGSHGRCFVLIEASEESGSPDLPAYLDALSERIGTPNLVFCLDSGCATYDRLWMTTSLRGNLVGTLRVDVLAEGVHSGAAGGVVPSSFRILRQLLSRVEDAATGEILLEQLHGPIPAGRRGEMRAVAEEFGDVAAARFPIVEGLQLLGDSAADRLANETWRPALAVTGMDGIPSTRDGGNVLRPFTTAKLSFRLPPSCDAEAALEAVRRAFETDPPSGAKVSFSGDTADGWDAPPPAPWLAAAAEAASRAYFGGGLRSMGEGGSIPFMASLGRRYPEVQFLATGVLGPESNAHGPNEFLHVPTAKAVTSCVAHVLDAHALRPHDD